jgi:hypothetical protein
MRAAGFSKLVVSRSNSTHASLLDEVSGTCPEEERHNAAARLGDSRRLPPPNADAYAALLADMANIFPM